ncbi:hypothetical protein DB313_06285 (plasmid) [Borrelia turcica IST7]|uniref:DUF228 domain-containing protein n=1 Tax=Borrelia turcica IST7 TaxID=1104446 RepID=A0A386PPU1_9SPIR|nr:DUF228 domain-containing protein [Borrelia turcica]AYE37108.1 hypothetical protein DB313_06285 [Borrelia turcica IST7]
MADLAKIREDYEKKVSELKEIMKNPITDVGLFSNYVDFKDKNLTFSNSGGTRTSSVDKLENYPATGYPYKRGVVLDFDKDNAYEFGVKAGGGDDLYGICIDIDEFSQIATVLPITNNFTGFLVLKGGGDNGIKAGDKLFFNKDGELEKVAGGNKTVNAIALSSSHKINNSVSIILASVFGNRALKGA